MTWSNYPKALSNLGDGFEEYPNYYDGGTVLLADVSPFPPSILISWSGCRPSLFPPSDQAPLLFQERPAKSKVLATATASQINDWVTVPAVTR